MTDPERNGPSETKTEDAAASEEPTPQAATEEAAAETPADTSSDPVSSPAVAETTAASPVARRSPLAIAALLVALAAWLGGYLAWQSLDGRLGTFAGGQLAFDERLATAVAASEQRGAALAAEAARLAGAIEHQQAAIERQRELAEQTYRALREEVGQDRNRWVVAEVEYLLRVATHRLALAGDVRTAAVALESADNRLADLADPAWLGVREQIADELAALRAVPSVDVEGLALALRSLAKRVDTLPVLGARYRPGDPRGTTPARVSEPLVGEGWSDALETAWAQVRGLVEVRRNDRPVEPMMAPALEYFLYHNLRLQLDAARLALLRGEAPLYLESLRSARDWAATYFDQGHAATGAMVAELDRLLAVDIAPPLPEVGEALRTLRAEPAYREAKGGDGS